MAKKNIGLYLGVNSLGGVVVSNNKILSLARYDMHSLEEEAKVENLHEEVKWEALINKTLRDIKAEGKSIYVSLADKDFIFRSLEMPLMSRKEIESSLAYEIEKYIPFKVEELMCDFSYVAFPKEKKVTISFVGMRENNFQRANEIFTRLGLEPAVVEPSSLSLARVLKTVKKFSSLKNYALLDFVDNEAYLTFFYHDLPVFNRYFAVPRTEAGIDLEKFIEPIHLSFQYFQREFKAYEPEKFIVVSNVANEQLLNLLKEELQKDIEMVVPEDIFPNETCYVENLKAFGTASRDTIAYKFKPSFLKRTKDQLEKGGIVHAIPWRVGILSLITVFAVLMPIAEFLFLKNDLSKKQQQFEKENANLVFPSFIEGLSSEQQSAILDSKESEARILREAPKGLVRKFSPLLRELSKNNVLTEGLWFDNLSLVIESAKFKGNIKGCAFLADINRERASINQFVTNLKENKEVKSIFSSLQLNNTQRAQKEGFEVTSFSITLE